MPARRTKEKIVSKYFTWLIGQRDGIWTADGRSNATNLGRHSLGTGNRKEALERLVRLDAVKAVESGRAPRSILDSTDAGALTLEEGQQLYLKHVARPALLGGATASSHKRYRAILDKFVRFARGEGVGQWQAVSKALLESYTAWLEAELYCYATEYIELTTIKQMMKWLVAEKKIPASCLINLPLKKPQGTSTYCYTMEEVQAMIDHCSVRKDLVWLGEVIVALATTGLRISELAELRWTDLDLTHDMIRLTDTRSHGGKDVRAEARTLKSHRDRAIPIHEELLKQLQGMNRHPDGRIFHGPMGGLVKPDTIRNVLLREVLAPLASRFAAPSTGKGLADGRLHSFRHYFCSMSANSGVSEQVLMTWLGHRDSKMVRHYYHLHQEESQRQMAKVQFVRPRNAEEESEQPPPDLQQEFVSGE